MILFLRYLNWLKSKLTWLFRSWSPNMKTSCRMKLDPHILKLCRSHPLENSCVSNTVGISLASSTTFIIKHIQTTITSHFVYAVHVRKILQKVDRHWIQVCRSSHVCKQNITRRAQYGASNAVWIQSQNRMPSARYNNPW